MSIRLKEQLAIEVVIGNQYLGKAPGQAHSTDMDISTATVIILPIGSGDIEITLDI